MLSWYRELIRLRRSTPELNNGEPGNTQARFEEEEHWLRVKRGNITVICNLAHAERSLCVPANSSVLLASRVATRVEDDKLVLAGNSVAVLQEPPED